MALFFSNTTSPTMIHWGNMLKIEFYIALLFEVKQLLLV